MPKSRLPPKWLGACPASRDPLDRDQLVIWETEGGRAQDLQDALIAASKTGEVKALAADPATAQSSWWVTTSPFITKDDFQR
jgi:hypothetical protein